MPPKRGVPRWSLGQVSAQRAQAERLGRLRAADPTATLKAELVALKPRALRARAAEAGIDAGTIEGAMDADDVKGALVAMLLESHARQARAAADAEATRRAELSALTRRELGDRAAAMEVPEAIAAKTSGGMSAVRPSSTAWCIHSKATIAGSLAPSVLNSVHSSGVITRMRLATTG